MVHVDFWMALAAFLLFLPQFAFVPAMQGAMNRRIRARVQIIRLLSISVVEAQDHDLARDRRDSERIQRVFELNMGFFKLKASMNFLMNLSTQLQIISALLIGGWAVYQDRLASAAWSPSSPGSAKSQTLGATLLIISVMLT